jgi:hypothetical protein
MLFGAGNVKVFLALKDILELFFFARGMELNKGKYSIRFNAMGDED